MNLPDSIKHLHGTLYLVPFDLIEIAENDSTSGKYGFENPRRYTEQGQNDLIDSELSEVLREDIKDKGLMVPIICRWMQEEGKIQLVGGERRYRAVSYLMENNIVVKDCSQIIEDKKGNKEYAWKQASQVYASIPCQIYRTEDDFEALAYSYSENACRKNFNQGHDIALLMELRKYKAPEDKILAILQKNKSWLRDTEELIKKLDPATLNDLFEGRINLLAAIKLSSIESVEERSEIRERANVISEEKNKVRSERDERRIERANREKEIALVEVKVATVQGSDEEISEAEHTFDKANAKVADAVTRQKENRKSTKGKDVIAAIKSSGNSNGSSEASKPKSLTQNKIKNNYLDYLTRVQRNDCACLESEPMFSLPDKIEKTDVLKTIVKIIKGIHDGDEDCSKILKKCFPN